MAPDKIQFLVIAALKERNSPALDVVRRIARDRGIQADAVRREIRRLLERGEISVGANLNLTIPQRPHALDRHTG